MPRQARSTPTPGNAGRTRSDFAAQDAVHSDHALMRTALSQFSAVLDADDAVRGG
jgi:hypothetical protein